MSKQAPLTELVDADIRRIDAVKGPANGNRFLIAKSEAPNMVSDEAVRALIADPVGDVYIGDIEPVAKSAPTKRVRKATLTLPDGMSLDDLRQAIAGALRDAGVMPDEGYVMDVMPTQVVFCGKNFDDYFQVAWTIDEAGNVKVGDSAQPVKQDHQWEPIIKSSKESRMATKTAPAEKTPAAVVGGCQEGEGRSEAGRQGSQDREARQAGEADREEGPARAGQRAEPHQGHARQSQRRARRAA